MELDNYTKGFDQYDEESEGSVGVKEILNFKDLSYGLFVNGELKKVEFLTVPQALGRFGHISEEVRQKILKHDN